MFMVTEFLRRAAEKTINRMRREKLTELDVENAPGFIVVAGQDDYEDKTLLPLDRIFVEGEEFTLCQKV